ncbi:hypothetical protein Glove_557g60 [Diversispora epigaea]|uniref:Protein kinase domain-containing protein n=1 Tax=Diversispora epigaea TaxID=1348612 RepID=A0A397GAX9_9GLOM|nr:hypothetical protein Glove_557g60 [Diversispora epigaea]
MQLKANEYTEIIEWIPFDRFENVKYLANGGFGKVYKAKWLDGCIRLYNHQEKRWIRLRQNNVCLKSFNTSTNKSAFLQEIKNQLEFRDKSAIQIYGITKNPSKNEYMMVMKYASEGSLRNMLNDRFNGLTSKDKFGILYYIALKLSLIHGAGLMHKNFHPVSENDHEKIYGIIPYLAPEILKGGEYTQASDIYAFGMVMLEVFTSYPPFYNIPHDENLESEICNGFKPEIKCEIPQLLKDIMEKCWDIEPCNRPTVKGLEIQLERCYESEKQIVVNKANEKFIQYNPKEKHPQAIYISRYLKHDSAVFGDILNSFQFLESDDNINKFSSEDIYQTDFFSVKATIMFGATATTNLEKLLLEQKDAIDNILKSQPVYAVGPNFQQGYSIPCIVCYVSKPLKTQVLENLSALFDHEFEIEEQVVEHMEDTSVWNDNQNDPSNKSNRINNDLSNNDVEMRDSSCNSNGNGDETVNGRNGNGDGNDDEIGNGGENNNGNADGDGDGDGDRDGVGGGSGSGKEEVKENVDELMEVSFEASIIYKNYEKEFQSFNFDAKLWANVSRDYKFSPPVNTLEFKINLFSCEVGKMLSEKCQKLHNFIGYYLDSVEIGVTPHI